MPFWVLVLAALTVPGGVAQSAPAPPLPRLALNAYPPAAREAIARAHAGAEAHASDAQAVATLARVLHAWEQWDAAHQAYARAQALAPRSFEWHYLDAAVLQRLVRHADAAAQLEAALAITPDYLPARLKLAEALLDAGDLEGSKRLFAALTDPDCAPATAFGLGRITAAEGRHDAAVEYFQRAIALFPEYGAAHYALALSYRALGRRDEARAALERHARFGARWPAIADPVMDSVTALRGDAGALMQRGVKLANDGDLDGAIAAHQAVLAIDPLNAQAHANLISIYGRQRNWPKAEEHYRAALSLGLDIADTHYDYAVLLGMQDRWDEAADAYRRALAVNPLHAQGHNNLGQILERQGRVEDATAEYRRAVESQPTLRIARFNLGRMLIATGRNDEAVTELQKIVEPRDAEAPRYLFALSTAFVRAGRRDEGIKWAADARDLARQFGDEALAAAIEHNLAAIR